MLAPGPEVAELSPQILDKILSLGPWGAVMIWSVVSVRRALLVMSTKWDQTLDVLKGWTQALHESTATLREIHDLNRRKTNPYNLPR